MALVLQFYPRMKFIDPLKFFAPKFYAPLMSAPFQGLQQVEVASTLQIPGLHIIGLPNPEVTEARERVRSAIESSGFNFPKRRIVLNLSPASIRKSGTGLDLAMALSILVSWPKSFSKGRNLKVGNVNPSPIRRIAAWGELGLDGSVKSAGQILGAIYAVWQNKIDAFFLPESDYEKALEGWDWIQKGGAHPQGMPLFCPVTTLRDAISWLESDCRKGSVKSLRPEGLRVEGKIEMEISPSLSSVLASASASALEGHSSESSDSLLMSLPPTIERQLGIIASGCHHFLFLGPQGVGKTHALEWLIAIYPPSTWQEKLEQRLIAELGQAEVRSMQPGPNFRKIGVGVRPAALIGGRGGAGARSPWVRPGEFSLAHGGILVADEILEWAQDSRECLREPLEEGQVTLTRVHRACSLPARFLLAATGNLCPCGGWPSEVFFPSSEVGREVGRNGGGGERFEFGSVRKCRCSYRVRKNYLARLSGPILDRIDILMTVSRFSLVQKSKERSENQSTDRVLRRAAELQSRVQEVRSQMVERWGKPPGLLSGRELETLLQKHPDWCKILSTFRYESLRLRHKTLRVAMTLGVWDGKDDLGSEHFAEAYCYHADRSRFEWDE